MANIRKKALEEFTTRNAGRFYVEERPISEFFGQNVFDLEKMKRYLSGEAYKAVVDIHVRPVIEHVERTVDVELQRRRDSLCLGLRLPLDLVV